MKAFLVVVLFIGFAAHGAETNDVSRRLRAVEEGLSQLDAKLSRQMNELLWLQRLGEVAVIDKVRMKEAAQRRIAGYSKGMRQRIKLALAIAHDPKVLILDEPLNGLDPMARAEVIELLRKSSEAGMHIVISSHILHEVDIISDRIVMISNGYVVAEGDIQGVRSEMEDHPMQILIRCDRPSVVAAQIFQQDSVVEAKIHADGKGLLVSTRNVDQFYGLFNRIVLENHISVEAVAPADENVHSVYEYLMGTAGGAAS